MVRIVVGEIVAPPIEPVPVLRVARERLDPPLVDLQAHASTMRIERGPLRMLGPRQRAAGIAEQFLVDDGFGGPRVGEVDPVVEPEERSIHRVLRVRAGEAREDDATHVGAAVAVGVLEVKEIRRRGDEHAPFPSHHAGRQHQALRKDTTPIEPAIAIRVFEQADAARRPRVERIPGHLHDKEAAGLVDVHRHRARDVRLARDRRDRVPGFELDRGDGGRRAVRRLALARPAAGRSNDRREPQQQQPPGHAAFVSHPLSQSNASA